MRWEIIRKFEESQILIAQFRYNSDACVLIDHLREQYPDMEYVIQEIKFD